MDNRFLDIEICLANCQKTIDELNDVVINQGKIIDTLVKQNHYLYNALTDNNIKPSSEETPPPHY